MSQAYITFTAKKREIVSCIVGILLGSLISYVCLNRDKLFDTTGIAVPMLEFPEPSWRTPATLAVKVCVVARTLARE